MLLMLKLGVYNCASMTRSKKNKSVFWELRRKFSIGDAEFFLGVAEGVGILQLTVFRLLLQLRNRILANV